MILKKILSVVSLFLFLFSTTLSAQSNIDTEIESLITEAHKYPQSPDSITNFGDRILLKSKPTSHLRGMIKGYLLKGMSNYMRGDMEKSIVYNDSALLFKDEGLIHEYDNTIQVYINKATAYGRKGTGDSAKVYFGIVRDLALKNKDYVNVAVAYNSLGIGAKNNANYSEAITLYEKALHIWDSLQQEDKKPSVLMNIGIAQSNLEDHTQANKSFHEALRIAKETKNVRDEYRTYNNLSVNLNHLKQYDSARFYLKKIIPYYKEKKHLRGEYLAYQNIGRSFLNEKKSDSASLYFTKALRGFKKLKNEVGKCEAYMLLGQNKINQGAYQEAITYVDSSIVIAKKLKLDNKLKGNYEVLAKAYEKLEDYKSSNTYLKYAEELEDKAYKTENAKNLNDLLTKHQVDRKDDVIDDLSEDKTFYKSTFFIVTAITLGLCVLLFFFIKSNNASKKELTLLREELEEYNKEVPAAPSTLLHLKSKAVLKTEALLYIKSDGHYLEFFSKDTNKPEIDRDTLKNCIEQLQSQGFAQIHKSYVVNLQYIRIINSTKIMLENGTWLPLSRTYKPKLKETLLSKPPL
ncbi:LytTR family transcriptional regulator DNA-binding domain-containing protein [Ulvibacter litoralis]|uniref:Tetratricopeptide repeat-containing protein n=1 Tax=Ulvibacter litoralis TaxID=227084 RepID=A0A1G7I4W0_9FLAO|nr:LytTR family transcriptional regulator DNA-binding domain-containing protein [Ulvibacter litoralis]GHC62498.1 hypothetical protein GCM10008083_29560 [Ulvibacter litoralis]SDF07752.1 Tetratricopeptide repeat-containing protein [Ulvibacter litoralis]